MVKKKGSCKECEFFHTLMNDEPCKKCMDYEFFKDKAPLLSAVYKVVNKKYE